jgi:hypothetical protein
LSQIFKIFSPGKPTASASDFSYWCYILFLNVEFSPLSVWMVGPRENRWMLYMTFSEISCLQQSH